MFKRISAVEGLGGEKLIDFKSHASSSLGCIF